MKNKLFLLLLFLLVVPLVFSFVSAHIGEEIEGVHEDDESSIVLPENIQKMIEYRKEQAQFYFKNLSFIIAFLAGIIGLLTPCSLAIVPAFFAFSFKEKKELVKMTLSFFLGFMPVFVAFGLLATLIGKSIAIFQQSNVVLVNIAGGVLIIFGIMAFFGKGFSGIHINKKVNKTISGMFLFGILFGLGFSACVGPILLGILLIAGTLQNYVYSGFLMFFYSLGLFVPLFLMAFFFDKYNFAKKMNSLNQKIGFSLTNVISGVLLVLIGLVFIIFGGTLFLDDLGIGLGSMTIFIYSIQNKLLDIKFINYIGILILGGFLYLLWRFLKKKNGKKKQED